MGIPNNNRPLHFFRNLDDFRENQKLRLHRLYNQFEDCNAHRFRFYNCHNQELYLVLSEQKEHGIPLNNYRNTKPNAHELKNLYY